MIMDYYKQAENVIDCIREKSKEEKLKLRIVNDWEIEQYVAGKQGEEAVNSELKAKFPNMILMDDIYFDLSGILSGVNGYKPSMQIDHILLSEHAMYVIETKKYSQNAVLKGTSYTQNWEYKDTEIKKSSRQNACLQNHRHIENLRKLIGNYLPPNVVSIVCLVNMQPENIEVSTQYGQYVFTLEELSYMIEAFEKKYAKTCISESSRNDLLKLVKRLNNNSFTQEVNHIIYVKLLKRKIHDSKKGKRRKKKLS